MSTKRTYQPSKTRRTRAHGYRSRSASVLKSRRDKGRHRMAPKA